MNIARVIQALATLSWVLVVGGGIVLIVRSARARPVKRGAPLLIGLIVFALVLTVIGAGLVFIEPNERGVVISPYPFRAPKGYLEQSLSPGLHWIVPGERVVQYSISRQTYTMSVAPGEGQVYGDDSIRARTNDGQEVYIDASVIFSIDPTMVTQLHIDWQSRYQNEVVRPLSRGIIRDAASQYGVEELVSTKRSEFENSITTELANKLNSNNLILVDFVLRDIHFSEEYAAAVEQKQIAEQQAIQAQYVVEQKKQEAEQARQIAQGQADARIIEAEAEAQALALIAAIIRNNPQLITYLYIQKISPNVDVMLLPSNAPFIFSLPSFNLP